MEKPATIRRFEYFPLGNELKEQTDIAKKQYQKLDDTFKFDKTIKIEKLVNQILYITVNIVFTNILVMVKKMGGFL